MFLSDFFCQPQAQHKHLLIISLHFSPVSLSPVTTDDRVSGNTLTLILKFQIGQFFFSFYSHCCTSEVWSSGCSSA